MNNHESPSMEILAMFAAFKEKRLKLYESFIKDIDDFDDWSISVERMIAYFITVRNLRKYGNIVKEKLQEELIRLAEGDFNLQ